MNYFAGGLGVTLFGPYFYQSWSQFEPTPEDVGYKFASDYDNATALTTLGEIEVLLALELDEEEFTELLRDLGVEFSGIPYTFRELVERTRDGIRTKSIERALAAQTDPND